MQGMKKNLKYTYINLRESSLPLYAVFLQRPRHCLVQRMQDHTAVIFWSYKLRG